MTVSGTTSLPVWGVIAVWASIGYMFLSSARAEERRRLQGGQPHTIRDTALLLLTALSVVGLLLCAFFIRPLTVLATSRIGIAAIILVIGGGLTFVFNRRGTPHQ